jgi:glutathione S-transferase
MFQVGGVGPMFGQIGFFHKFAGKDFEDKRPRDRYVGEAKRLLAVLEGRLARAHLDDGRRLHDRRHRDLPVGAQPRRLLRRGRAGRHRRVSERDARARRVRGTAGGAGGPR